MDEIEYRTERAQAYYQHFIEGNNIHKWEWCVYVGLWETSGWISIAEDQDKYKRTCQYDLLKLVIPGQRGTYE